MTTSLTKSVECEQETEHEPVPDPSRIRKERWETRSYSSPPNPFVSDSDTSSDNVNAGLNVEKFDVQEMSSYVIVNYEGAYFPG